MGSVYLDHKTMKGDVAELGSLPDELIEQIIAYLPIAGIFRASCLSKKWYGIVSSTSFLRNLSNSISHKPWYFMFISSYNKPHKYGHSYDPVLRNCYGYDPVFRKRYRISLPCIKSSDWFKVSSCGLVCFMDYNSRSKLYVCNPITQRYKKLTQPPEFKRNSIYTALAISVNRVSHEYIVTIVESQCVPNTFSQYCDLLIHVYDSVTTRWKTPINEVLTNWEGADNGSVICDGVLYFLMYATGDGSYDRKKLIAYNLSIPSNGSLMKNPISVPFPLTCIRLMNLNENLVLVGGIGIIERNDITNGIGIWILRGKEWEEIARMPHEDFLYFRELDDVFASSGAGDLIYIHSYESPALLVFDMSLKNWKWSRKRKRFPHDELFSGFCFEPRLEIAP